MEVRRPRPPRGGNSSDRTYQRTYKACIPCRERKAKCDLGELPDGSPMGPPCAKCRREQRQCVFSETRSWQRRKQRESQQGGTSTPPRTRRKLSSDIRFHDKERQGTQRDLALASDHDGHQETNIIPHQSYASEIRQARQQSTSTLDNSMMRTVVSSGNDALNILFEAAAVHSQEAGLIDPGTRSRSIPNTAAHNLSHESPLCQMHSVVSPGVLAKIIRPVELSCTSNEVLSTWEACRFVMMGWFTSKEAVTLIDLFFKNMSPLSPILTDFYANHQHHRELITCDPFLCCTILMLSSRYHVLPGPGESRNFFIHHRLWQHCQQLVTRLIFGQERALTSKLRSIGTIEALLLMSEWHPRSLHFPPESDGWDADLILKAPEPKNDDSSAKNRLLEDMIEPARRSDQMSWMLLGAALSLSHELGVFEVDEEKRSCFSPYEGCIPDDHIKLRRQRVQRLLYVYINQLAWRIGCVSLMPQSLNHAIFNRQRSTDLKQTEDQWLVFMDSWMDLTKLAKSVTDMFFPSVSFARQQLHSGRYIDLLDHFRPLLLKWKKEHLRPEVLQKQFFDILFIEYYFVRAYTHSIGMQAVVERVLADSDPNCEEIRAANVDPTDYEYIQEVIEGCCQILQKVTELGEGGALRFSPVRLFLRITSSSIFLLKALSLGCRHRKVREALDILERTIQALKSNALDDIHLSTRYAALLETHVSHLRRNLLASSKVIRNSYGCTARSSMAPLSNTNTEGTTPTTDVPASVPPTFPDWGFIDLAADDWLSLPFDPSMAPFGINGGGQFPAYEGGGLNFIWNLPS